MKKYFFIIIVLFLVSCLYKSVPPASDPNPTITKFTFNGNTIITTITTNTPYQGSVAIPYLQGNKTAYAMGSAINSTVVLGLTATLQAGFLSDTGGKLIYQISGTPTSIGVASFDINFAGIQTTIKIQVNAIVISMPSISRLNCPISGVQSGIQNTAYSNIINIPYLGGNGVSYNAGIAIASTGVLGLTATLSAGKLKTNGDSLLSYTIAGTPTSIGTATFPISFGGQTCQLNITINAQTITYSNTIQVLMTTNCTTTPSCHRHINDFETYDKVKANATKMLQRMKSVNNPMPPPPMSKLNQIDIDAFQTWINNGHPQ